MTKMDKLKLAVRAYKGHLTRSFNNCDTLLSQDDLDEDKIQATVQPLTTKWANYERAYNEVEIQFIGSDGSEQEVDDFQNEYYRYYKQYQESKMKLRTMANKLKKNKDQGLQGQKPGSSEASARPKLPSIQP